MRAETRRTSQHTGNANEAIERTAVEAKRKRGLTGLAAGLLAATAVGCGGGAPGPAAGEGAKEEPPPIVSNEPTTLTFFNMAGIGDLTFQTLIEEPIRQKYPHIKLVLIKNEKGSTLEDLLTAGTPPDLIHATTAQLPSVVEAGLHYDMTELIRRHKFDLTIFQDGVIDSVQGLSPKGEIYGLPANNNTPVLYYNKDIFDKFGVSYPQDAMTWDETLELARKVTRTADGIAYKGLRMTDSFLLNANPLSLTVLDPATDEPLHQADKWRSLFANWKRFYELPGNELDSQSYGNGVNELLKERNVAMLVANNLVIQIEQMKDPSLNWDMVSMPTFPEAPKTATQMIAPLFMISPTAKQKDVAFQVVAEMFADSVQRESALTGRPTLMKNSAIQEQIGKELTALQGKNTNAFNVNKLAPMPRQSPYEAKAKTILNRAYRQIVLGEKDMNTALREAEEDIRKMVAEEKQKGK